MKSPKVIFILGKMVSENFATKCDIWILRYWWFLITLRELKMKWNELTEKSKDMKSFTYLGGILDKHSGTDANVKVRIGRVRATFLQMENI